MAVCTVAQSPLSAMTVPENQTPEIIMKQSISCPLYHSNHNQEREAAGCGSFNSSVSSISYPLVLWSQTTMSFTTT